MTKKKSKSFFAVLTEAINHFVENGFTSQAELDRWTIALKKSLLKTIGKKETVDARVRKSLKNVYRHLVIDKKIIKQNKGVSKFSVDKLKPTMRRDLEKRIMASTRLIKLNREVAVANTLRRFQGWATSIPKGGSKAPDIKKEKTKIRKSLTKVTFEEKRVTIDQSQKFASSLNAVIAEDNGAIAAVWHSRWRTAGYNYRHDHKERDGKMYVIRNNWAMRKGLMKLGDLSYNDTITQPAEEVYCQCRYTYIYSIDKLPEELLTEKGKELLAKAGVI